MDSTNDNLLRKNHSLCAVNTTICNSSDLQHWTRLDSKPRKNSFDTKQEQEMYLDTKLDSGNFAKVQNLQRDDAESQYVRKQQAFRKEKFYAKSFGISAETLVDLLKQRSLQIT